MAGYTRQSVADIIASAVIRAAPVNAEFNAVRDAFAQATGHTHDGSASEGAYVPLISDTSAFNKVVVDSTNNRISFYSDVSSVAVEQVRIEDGVFVPVTDNDVDLGSASAEFKDLYLDGIGYIDTLAVHENATVAGTLAVTGLSTLANVDIGAGTIDGTAVGSTTPAAGAFTTLSSTTGVTGDLTGDVAGNLTGNVTGNVTGNLTGNVTGNVTAATGTSSLNDLTVSGNTILGNAATDTVTVTADVASNLIPSVDSTYTLGDASNYWSSAHIDAITTTGNVTVGGALSVTGTADFTNTTLNNVSDPTTAQQAATKAYVDAQVSGLVDAAPGALDTLNELAAAIGDDASFSTTVTNSIATKLPLAGGTMTGNIALGGYLINGAALTPTTASELTSKSYVDSILGSATAASVTAAAVAATYDAFDDRYLGSKTSAPTLDNDGDALLTGALYWDSTSGGLYVWNGASWEIAGQRDELLQAIAATKTVTAVDVFVYDTSKDSDGGAWRKRTQGTSWYNETLDTATRGSRKEFPAVAVIVAEAAKFTIYDGDDPSLPMWRVTNALSGVTPQFWRTGRNATSVCAINGKLAIGLGTDGSAGLAMIDFVADNLTRWSDGGSADGTLSGTSNDASVTATLSGILPALVNTTVNDVVMTVLPDAPIDPATGLQVPIIAVATDGGVSVIKDDGTVVDTTDGNAYNTVFFTDDNRLWLGRAGAGIIEYGDIFTADVSSVTWRDGYYGTNTLSSNLFLTSDGADRFDLLVTGAAAATNGDRLAFISENPTTSSEGMVAYTTSTYNTGWMNGDIKGAFLSDTDDTDLVESGELVTNGTFDTDTTGWTGSASGVVSYDAGNNRLELTNGAADNGVAYQAITTVIGKTYVATATMAAGTAASPRFGVGTGSASASLLHNIKFIQANGDVSITFVATTTTTYVGLSANTITSGLDCFLDNVSVQLADYDRSVNNNGLIINGTVTRDPVATGADLVAYSGLSDSNYLEQPYNSDLDFGTGDFCVIGWVKDANVGYTTVMSKAPAGTRTAPYFDFGFDTSTAVWGGGVIYKANAVSSGWSFVSWVRNSGVLYLYVNGVQLATAANTENYSHSNTDVLYVGKRGDNGRFAPAGGLALWRISATAPTASQIAKVYNDEKVLFQENAQATLYGTSDAVTALAHDSDTNLLHVGTSDGRSVFQGLRRVSNTTTAVGTAISASNGLVVEE